MKRIFIISITVLLSIVMYAQDNLWNYNFIENKGQIIDQNNNLNLSVKYLWNGNGIKVQLKGNSFSYEVFKTQKFPKRTPKYQIPNSNLKHKVMQSLSRHGNAGFDDSTVIYSHRIDIELVGANTNPIIVAHEPSTDCINFYTTGTPENGIIGVHHYKKVTYKNIYPHIDMVFTVSTSNNHPIKYDFIIHPAGNIKDIQLRYHGANDTKLKENGEISISTESGQLEESIPSSYLLENNKNVQVKYTIIDHNVFGFIADNYDISQTLIVDPWGTYIGPTGSSISIDAGIYSIVAGSCDATFNIATTGAFQTVFGGGGADGFIMKFNNGGIAKLWATFYGGNGIDGAEFVKVGNSGSIYLAGNTESTNNIATNGAYQDTLNIGFASFIAKFNSNGIRQFGTYFPAFFYGFTIDSYDNMYVTGFNSISGLIGFTTPNAHQQNEGGGIDAFLAKFDVNGNKLWCTYYGGAQDDKGGAVSVDSSGNVFISGWTMSTNNIASSSAFQTNLGGISDYFIAKFSSSGVRQWGTYYGGIDDEDGYTFMTNDKSGNVYLSARIGSLNYFATPGAFQVTPSGMIDYFISKFGPSGARLWSTYFGGNNDEEIWSIITDNSQNVIFVGNTSSTNNISTQGAYQINYPINTSSITSEEGFIEKFSPLGARIWGTYLGDSIGTRVYDVATDIANKIYLSGYSGSPTGITTTGTYQPNLLGTVGNDFEGFIICFDSTGHFTTSIEEVNPTVSLIKVYPNPAKDKITISIKDYAGKGGSISLFSIEGKLLRQQYLKTETTSVDMSGFPSGTYLLQYEDGEVCETVKVVKE